MVLCRHRRWSIAGHCSLPPSWEGRRDDTDAQVVVGDLVHLAVAGPGGVRLWEPRPKGLEARLAAEVGPATGISLLVVEALFCRSIGSEHIHRRLRRGAVLQLMVRKGLRGHHWYNLCLDNDISAGRNLQHGLADHDQVWDDVVSSACGCVGYLQLGPASICSGQHAVSVLYGADVQAERVNKEVAQPGAHISHVLVVASYTIQASQCV